jgi:CRP-like cAMP-binding protein
VLLLDAVPLFKMCTARQLEELAETACPVRFNPGEALCTEGEASQDCFVIFAGEATATIGTEVVGEMGPNDIVGERGPVLNMPRQASVVAATHMLAYAISGDRLRRLAQDNPALGTAMRDEIDRQYRPLTG